MSSGLSESEKQELNWLLAKAHNSNPEFEEEELSDFDKAKKEAKLLDVATRQLKAYSLNGMHKDTIIDNCATIKETFASLTAQRYKLPGEDLKKAKEYLEFANWFVENNQADPVAKDVSGACLFIQKYFEVLGLETEYGYPAKYEPGKYRKYYEIKQEEELLHTPYDKLSRLDIEPKMIAHSRRAARLISAMAGVKEEEEPEEDFQTIHLKRLTEAIKELRERRESKSQHEQELSQVTDFPEHLRLAQIKQELSKRDPTEPSREYKLCKEASKRIRTELVRAGKITAIEE